MKGGINIKNEMLSWAISRAGFETNTFIEEKFPRVRDWLDDEKEPTIPQLRDFANKVNLPFGYLFLDNPPAEPLPIPFFRTLDGETSEVSLSVRDTILTLQKRQCWLSEYYDNNNYEALDFVGKFKNSSNVKEITNSIREVLGLEGLWASDATNWEDALDKLSSTIEEHRIIVTFNSVVGNNTHRKIPVDECRGFVLVDEYAPFLFVNSADSKAAQMFTIIHELAHVWIGESAGFDFRNMQPTENDVERLCDKIAAEFLVPEEVFHDLWDEHQDFRTLAKKFKVSPIVVGRRALDLGKITKDTFFDFYNSYMEGFHQKKEEGSSGGNFYATLRKRLNPRFIAEVHRATKENNLLYRDAYELTGLRSETYHKAIKEFEL
jgi:Zn-dependent peptidase ImmA (M78 family)